MRRLLYLIGAVNLVFIAFMWIARRRLEAPLGAQWTSAPTHPHARQRVIAPDWLKPLLPPLAESAEYDRPPVDEWLRFHPPTLVYDLMTHIFAPLNLTYALNTRHRDVYRWYDPLKIYTDDLGNCARLRMVPSEMDNLITSAEEVLSGLARLLENFHQITVNREAAAELAANVKAKVLRVRAALNEQARQMERDNRRFLKIDDGRDGSSLPSISQLLQLNMTTLVVPMSAGHSPASWMFFESVSRIKVWPHEIIFVTLLQSDSAAAESATAESEALLATVELFVCSYLPLIPAGVSVRWIIGSHEGGGPMMARYIGAMAAETPLVMMFDSDDYLAPLAVVTMTGPFITDPHLDHVLSGYSYIINYHSPKTDKWEIHVDKFLTLLLDHVKQLDIDWRRAAMKIQRYLHSPEYTTARAHKQFVDQWKNSSRLYRPNSIHGWPNIAYSRSIDYWQLYQKRKRAWRDHKFDVVRKSDLETAFKQLDKGGGDDFYCIGGDAGLPGTDEEEDLAARHGPDWDSATDALSAQRQEKDEDWLKRRGSLSYQESHGFCANGWVALRRDVFDFIRPGMDIDYGEDSNFNMQTAFSGLFNSVCLTTTVMGVYTPVAFSNSTLIVRREF